MKQTWQKTSAKVDALTLRERGIIFVLAAVVIVVAVNTLLLDPLFAKQKRLSDKIRGEQGQIVQMQTAMHQTILGQGDADVVNRARLENLTQQTTQMRTLLLDMHSGLIAPENMTVLLEDILRRHGSLRLSSLKTLPVTSLAPAPVGADPTGVASNKGGAEMTQALVYVHPVEIVVQGRYLEMLAYMRALETLPWHLYWSKASLKVDEYPQATLTLTLSTMSLNRQWLNL